MSDIINNNVVKGQFENAQESLSVKEVNTLLSEKEMVVSEDKEDDVKNNDVEGNNGDEVVDYDDFVDYDESVEDGLDFMEWNENKDMTNQYLKFAGKISMGTNPQCSKFKQSLLKMGQDKIYLGLYSGASFRKTDNHSEKSKDKADRATLEKALNRATVLILHKMLNKIYTGIDGCVSTGKEANVYHATAIDGASLAVKVFKTVASDFRNRAKYMEGEYRFKFNTCTKNISKLVPKWVEKEFRNLHRIYKAGIPSPEPICMNNNVLVMSFIGMEGRPAQKLKDYNLSVEEALQMYVACVRMMRRMFQQCKLVHADLSEFNMLVHEGRLYIIDVSQSLEMDNPSAIQFLHADITNVTSFFRRQQVNTMTHQQLKAFIVEESVKEDAEEACIAEEMHKAVTDAYNEQDDDLREENEEEKLLNPFSNDISRTHAVKNGNISDESDEEIESITVGDDHENCGKKDENLDIEDKNDIYNRDKRESLEDKKTRKHVIKELQREKRTHKIPKSEKKRRIKMSKGKR